MKIVTADQMRSLEAAAAAAGTSYADMMERAGRAVAQTVAGLDLPEGAHILVLVGPGNNGGDGLVAARALADAGAHVVCYIWKRDLADDPNLRLAQERPIEVIRQADDAGLARFREELARCSVLIDGLLGTGTNGPLRDDLTQLLSVYAETMAALEPCAEPLQQLDRPGAVCRRRPIVVAVDLPTGVNADTGAADDLTPQADLTVTFAFPKAGLLRFPGAALAGTVFVADIGIAQSLAADVSLELADAALVRTLLPERPADANKGTFGKAMVVAGSANFAGAPYLAAMAAARVGAGLVTLAVPQMLYPVLAARAVEPTFVLLPSDMGALTPAAVRVVGEALDGYKALLVGPGIGREKATVEFVRDLLGHRAAGSRSALGFVQREAVREAHALELPATVVDADALNALAETPDWWQGLKGKPLVLTPHPGELARLSGSTVEEIQADRLAAARAAAAEWQQIVVLKGAFTVIAAPDGRATVLPFANPALASAGTGDVLAGAIAGMLAQGLAPEAAAVVGGYLHGLAGELARDARGDAGVLAGDLLPELPAAIRELQGE